MSAPPIRVSESIAQENNRFRPRLWWMAGDSADSQFDSQPPFKPAPQSVLRLWTYAAAVFALALAVGATVAV
jgi:hypothetical protein